MSAWLSADASIFSAASSPPPPQAASAAKAERAMALDTNFIVTPLSQRVLKSPSGRYGSEIMRRTERRNARLRRRNECKRLKVRRFRERSRSEERRVGKERVSTCRSRGAPYDKKKDSNSRT